MGGNLGVGENDHDNTKGDAIAFPICLEYLVTIVPKVDGFGECVSIGIDPLNR